MKRFLFISGVAFAIALAVVIGLRLSADAMAVIVGIVCGVLASLPGSVILVWVLRHQQRTEAAQQQPTYPPVVVVNGQPRPTAAAPPSLPGGGGPRHFKIIGQEKTEAGGDLLPSFWDE